MGIEISYPNADLYWGGMEGSLSPEQAYEFFRYFGYWPNGQMQQLGESYMQSAGIGMNDYGYAASSSTGSPVYTPAGLYFAPQYDALGNVVGSVNTDAQGNIIPQGPATDWYAEAAAGNPVIGASVTPGMSATQYNRHNRYNPTSVQPGSTLEQQFVQQTNPDWTYQQPTTLAYDPGQGLPTPNTEQQSMVNAITNLPNTQNNNQQYSGAGTIGNFWNDSGDNEFNTWWQQTYGQPFGLY